MWKCFVKKLSNRCHLKLKGGQNWSFIIIEANLFPDFQNVYSYQIKQKHVMFSA